MGKAVGVELNESRVKVIAVEANSKRTRILAYHEEAIPVDPAKTWDVLAVESLKKAFTASKISRGKVVASIDSGDAILRDVSLPFKEEDKIRKTIHAELESLIHNYTIEDLVVDYFKTGETDKGTVLMAAAVPKALVEKRLALFTQGGLDPVSLDLDVSALFNTFAHVGAIDTDDPLLVLYGTPKYTKILLVEKKRPTSIRTIRFSMPTKESIAKEQEERKKASMWETHEVEHEIPIVVLEDDEHAKFSDLDFDTQSSLMEILAKEISRFLLANAATASPTKILLTGEYENEDAAHLLEAATAIPVKTFDLLEVVDHPFAKDGGNRSAKVAVPLGLALKGCDVDVLGMDFRKERFSYGKKFETLKTTAFVTVELIIVFLATIALHLHFKKRDLRAMEKQVLEYHNDVWELVSQEKRLADSTEAFPKVQEHANRILQDYGVQHPLERSGLEVWRQLYAAAQGFQMRYSAKPAGELGGADLYLFLDEIVVVQDQRGGKPYLEVQVAGKAATVRQADLFKAELASYRERTSGETPFKGIDYTGTLQEVDGKVPFRLRYPKGN